MRRAPISKTLALAFALLCTANVRAEETSIPNGSLELIADKQWIAAGHDVSIGLHFQLEKGWHIYWVNPGDSGEPPRVIWQLPPGLTTGPIEWPAPQRFETSSTIVDYGYEDDVLLIVPLHADSKLAALQTAELAAEVRLLICSHEMCVPGKAILSLTLPVKSQTPAPDPETADLFAAARKSQPRPAPSTWKVSVTDANDSFVLTAILGHQVTHPTFFPLAESQIENAAPQKLSPEAAGFRLTLRKSDQLVKPIERLKGVLAVSPDAAYLVDVPVSKPGTAKSASNTKSTPLQ